MLIYAHRGSSGKRPENTLAAFRQAIADGADGVEFDVRATADGVPVVLHDRGLERTTTGRGNVDELPLAAVRGFRAGQGQAVPTMEEAVELLAGRLRLHVELKQAGIEREVLGMLEGYPQADWVITSLDWETLRAVRRLDPTARLWAPATVGDDALFQVAAELGAEAIALFAGALDEAVARRCEESGLGLMVWTVNDVAGARRARALGAAALCTDVPATILAGLGETGPARSEAGG